MFEAVLRHSDAPQPLGGPIRVDLDYINSQKGAASFDLDWRWLPKDLEIRVSDEGGRSLAKKVYRGPLGIDGMAAPTMEKRYGLKPGERVRMGFDLSLLFTIEQPGSYELELLDSGVTLATGRLRIVRLEGRQEVQINGLCEHWAAETVRYEAAGDLAVQARLEVGDIPEPGDSTGYALLRDVVVGGERSLRSPIRVLMPKSTRVQAQTLDVRWQLWTVLTAGGESSLVIWDLKNQRARFAIPWGKQAIELGSIQARPGSYAKVVIAGRTGQAKLSTLDEASADVQEARTVGAVDGR